MMNRKRIYSLIMVLSTIVFSACGSDTKVNPVDANTGPNSFVNATTPLTISPPAVDENGTLLDGKIYQLRVQLLEHGFSKPGETIKLKPFDRNYGFVTNDTVLTDKNGEAIFDYNYPDDYAKIRGQDITVEAVYFDPTQVIVENPYGPESEPRIELTQEFVLQFR